MIILTDILNRQSINCDCLYKHAQRSSTQLINSSIIHSQPNCITNTQVSNVQKELHYPR